MLWRVQQASRFGDHRPSLLRQRQVRITQVLPGEPSDAGQSTPIGSIKLAAARMQRVDFQLVLRATEGASAARNVTVTVQSAGLAAQITPSVRQVDHANVSLASNAAGRVGLFPDPLPESPHARVSSDGEATAFWITMTAPAAMLNCSGGPRGRGRWWWW